MFTAQKRGRNVNCSRQISEEASALLNNSADFSLTRKRMLALEKSLSDQRGHSFLDVQSPTDGSWGRCYESWSWKVVETINQIKELEKIGKRPRYPPRIFDQINSPDKLKRYITSVLISDPLKDGINRRRELNEVVTSLIRVIRKGLPKNYAWHPNLWESFQGYMDQEWQNQDTGFWGAWYKEGDRIIKTDDLSITFHIVSYRNGEVPLWNKLVRTMLRIVERPYPFGARHADGSMSNHHNYDVVRILRYGFPYLSETEKIQASREIHKTLTWCLKESLQPDGSFKYNFSDDSLGDSYYFGISVLDEAGYFDKKNRFWTEADFPEAEEVRQRILKNLRNFTHRDVMLEDALGKLEGR
jgi:hypothetical protein